MNNTFTTYRYTRVKGSDANNHPSLAWEFQVNEEKDEMRFRVARCSEGDQFEYQKAKEILSKRDWISCPRVRKYSLVENALIFLPDDQFGKLIEETKHLVDDLNFFP